MRIAYMVNIIYAYDIYQGEKMAEEKKVTQRHNCHGWIKKE